LLEKGGRFSPNPQVSFAAITLFFAECFSPKITVAHVGNPLDRLVAFFYVFMFTKNVAVHDGISVCR